MVKSGIISVFVFSLLFINVSVSRAQDSFSSLEGITIGQTVDQTILSLGTKVANPDTFKDIYTFESNEYAHPHFIYLTDGKLSFIELTVPFAMEQKYQDLMLSYKNQESLELERSETETMKAFPQSGNAFVLNGRDGKVLRIQKFPPTSDQAFLSNEGKGFLPVSNPSPDIFLTSGQPVTPTPTSSNPKKLLFLGISVLAALAVIVFILTRKKALQLMWSLKINLKAKTDKNLLCYFKFNPLVWFSIFNSRILNNSGG